jgi:hypothetical protein
MKPLNSKERAKAFYKVTGLFVFCFVLAMLLGFSTMKEKNVTDYTSRKQLEALKNNLIFQEQVFQPNIEDATRKLKDLPNSKASQLSPANIATSIDASLGNIKKEWIVNEKDQQYIMYKNIVDIYFALEAAYLAKFKLEEQLEAKENNVKTGSSDLQRVIDQRDEFGQENKSLKSEKEILSSNIVNLQKRLKNSRDSLRSCSDQNKGYKQQIDKLRGKSR